MPQVRGDQGFSCPSSVWRIPGEVWLLLCDTGASALGFWGQMNPAGKDQCGQSKHLLILCALGRHHVAPGSGVRRLPSPEPSFPGVSRGLCRAKSNKHPSVLQHGDLALIFDSMFFEMACLFFKTLFHVSFLNPEFSRVFGWIPESFLFSLLASSSFVCSSEGEGPQASSIALPRAHCGVCTNTHTHAACSLSYIPHFSRLGPHSSSPSVQKQHGHLSLLLSPHFLWSSRQVGECLSLGFVTLCHF